MFAAFLFSARLYLQLCLQSFRRDPSLGRMSIRGRLLRLLVYLLFVPVWLLHWLGFLLDEIFFFRYRRVVIEKPVFVLGVPRSGTTFLHRTMAADDAQFTTLSTWEVFLAPSVTQRKFWHLLAWLDRLIGRPFARLVTVSEKRLFKGLEGVHDVSLEAAEEDYLLLLPMLSCFILFLPFTDSNYIWNLARMDWDMPERDRERIMTFYKSCLKKHMHFHGMERCYLSKNAAFASWIDTLAEHFPDARFVVCLREPHRAVPSLIGSLQSGAQFFELDLQSGALPERLVSMMQDSYRHLLAHGLPDHCKIVHMQELKADITATIENIYRCLDIELTQQYRNRLAELSDAADGFKTRTRPIDPGADSGDDYFRVRFPWYYESAGNSADEQQPRS